MHNALRYISLISSRTSHSLRTPLGITRGVVDDIAAGIELEEVYIKDAQAAIHSLEQIANFLTKFSLGKPLIGEQFKLDEFLSNENDQSWQHLQEVEVLLELGCSSGARSGYPALLAKAIEVSLPYFVLRQQQFGHPEEQRIHLILEATATSEQLRIGSKEPRGNVSTGEGALLEFVESTHLQEALGLLLLDCVALEHGGNAQWRMTNTLFEVELTFINELDEGRI